MPTPTYKPLATKTLTVSTSSTVIFSTIPATYRDLILVIEGTYTTGTGNVTFRFNGDTGTNYSNVYMLGGSGGPVSGALTGNIFYTGGFNSAVRNISVTHIMDYSATDKHKTVLNRMDEGGNVTYAWANRWASTSAITSITILGNNPFLAGSTFSLYGIVA